MADRYGTVAGFLAYHTARNTDLPATAADAEAVDAALLVASEYIDARYRSSFSGLKRGYREQVREWPRSAAVDIYGYGVSPDTVPTEIENAAYEVALRQLRSPGSLSKDYTPNKYDSASISGAVSVKYASFGSAFDTQTQIAVVAEILAPLLTGHGAGSSLVGSVGRG